MADYKLAIQYYDSDDKALRLQAAYHTQQAIEKTIKLKAEIQGLNLWGHEIDLLIKKCDVTSAAWHRFMMWRGRFVPVREVSIG